MKDKRKELIIGGIAIGVIVLAAITVAIILLTSKDKPSGDEVEKSLTLDQTSISEEIVIGQETVAVLTAITKNITEELVWASSNEDVATVDASGETAVVTLKSAGSATITVKAGNIGALCQVAVKEVESKITLSQTTLVEGIVKGKTKVVTLTATLENLEGNVEWTVNNDKVASIVGKGETADLTLKGIGEAVVTAKVGEKSATCNVKVNDETSMITLNTTNITEEFKNGKAVTKTLEATLLNVKDDLKWTTSNSKVAKVEKIGATKAKVTIVGAGNATITVTDGKVNATCSVTAKEIKTSLTLNTKGISHQIVIGAKDTLTNALTAKITNGSGTINWKSSNESVATVTKTGTKASITVLKSGTTTITAECKIDGTTYKATCTVVVSYKAAEIKLKETSVNKNIIEGYAETSSITVEKLVNIPNDATVVWESSNEDVATVAGDKAKATVTLKGKGKAVITAKVMYAGTKIVDATCNVEIGYKATTISLDGTSLKQTEPINDAGTVKFKITNLPKGVTANDLKLVVTNTSVTIATKDIQLGNSGTGTVKVVLNSSIPRTTDVKLSYGNASSTATVEWVRPTVDSVMIENDKTEYYMLGNEKIEIFLWANVSNLGVNDIIWTTEGGSDCSLAVRKGARTKVTLTITGPGTYYVAASNGTEDGAKTSKAIVVKRVTLYVDPDEQITATYIGQKGKITVDPRGFSSGEKGTYRIISGANVIKDYKVNGNVFEYTITDGGKAVVQYSIADKTSNFEITGKKIDITCKTQDTIWALSCEVSAAVPENVKGYKLKVEGWLYDENDTLFDDDIKITSSTDTLTTVRVVGNKEGYTLKLKCALLYNNEVVDTVWKEIPIKNSF